MNLEKEPVGFYFPYKAGDYRGWGCSSVFKHLLCLQGALSSIKRGGEEEKRGLERKKRKKEEATIQTQTPINNNNKNCTLSDLHHRLPGAKTNI